MSRVKPTSTAPAAGDVVGGVQTRDDGKLRIIVFGAHPDDAEIRAGGVGHPLVAAGASREAGLGHQRRHRPFAAWPAARWPRGARPRCSRPPRSSARPPQVLDIHDGELEPTLENRRTITRLIRALERRHRHRPPAQRLPSRPPLRGRADAGFGLHGHGALLLPGHAAPGQQPGVPLFVGRLPAAQPVPGRRRGGDRRA